MRYYLKYIIIVIVVVILFAIGLLVLLHTSKLTEEPTSKEINLYSVTVDTCNDESAPLEERLFSYLMKASVDLEAPWEIRADLTKVIYDDDGNPVFEVVNADSTYRFVLSDTGVIYKIYKTSDLNQADLQFTINYGGVWSYQGMVDIWNFALMDIDTYSGYNIKESETETETEIILRPMSVNTTVDLTGISDVSVSNNAEISDDQLSYAVVLPKIESEYAPWYGLKYTIQKINAEDGKFEFLITVENGEEYRMRVTESTFNKYYKRSPFTEGDVEFVRRCSTTWLWEEAEDIDGWHVMVNREYWG